MNPSHCNPLTAVRSEPHASFHLDSALNHLPLRTDGRLGSTHGFWSAPIRKRTRKTTASPCLKTAGAADVCLSTHRRQTKDLNGDLCDQRLRTTLFPGASISFNRSGPSCTSQNVLAPCPFGVTPQHVPHRGSCLRKKTGNKRRIHPHRIRDMLFSEKPQRWP